MTAMKIVLFGFLGLLIFVLIAIVFFASGERSFEKSQNEYFSKVDYFIEGKIMSSRLLGGDTYFYAVNIDTIIISKNQLTNNDDFVGLYWPQKNKIFIIAHNEFGQSCSYKEIVNDSLPNIQISSSKREITYYSKSTYIDFLMSNNIYKDRLLKIETKEMIRF